MTHPTPTREAQEREVLETAIVQAIIKEYCFDRHIPPPLATNIYSKQSVKDAFARLAFASPLPGREAWQPIETAPKEGFFLVWGPHLPELAFPYEAERFWKAQDPSWPAHLSSRCFTLWLPMPLPAVATSPASDKS